ncbi:hypothetical protein THAOC_36868, partial [Thalassiosira oceanica]
WLEHVISNDKVGSSNLLSGVLIMATLREMKLSAPSANSEGYPDMILPNELRSNACNANYTYFNSELTFMSPFSSVG